MYNVANSIITDCKMNKYNFKSVILFQRIIIIIIIIIKRLNSQLRNYNSNDYE